MTGRGSGLSGRSDLSGMKPGELFGLRLQAIAGLDIETAQAADEALVSRRSSETTQTVIDVKAELETKIEEAFQNYRSDCERVRNEHELQDLQVRMAMDDMFQECQRRHISELDAVEKEYALAVLREERRPAKGRRECEKQARRFAFVRNYQSSIKMREQAKVAEQEELEERRAQVKGHFEKVRQNVCERQKVDLTVLNRKFNDAVVRQKVELGDALKLQEKKFWVALRAVLQKAITAATASADAAEEKLKIAESINTLFSQKVADTTRVFGSDSPKSRTARSPSGPSTPIRERERSPRITDSPLPASPAPNEPLDDPVPDVTARVQSPTQDQAAEPEENAAQGNPCRRRGAIVDQI
jgi:hypothetical protein